MLINWRVTITTKKRFFALANEFQSLDNDDERKYVIKDEINCLPGFPQCYDEFRDIINLEVIDTSGSFSEVTIH